MALDDHIYNLRREKLKQIEALGQATYRSKYEFTHTLDQILAEYTPKTAEELEQARVAGSGNVRVAGRIMAIRLMGKAGFAHLQQNGKRLQIYVKKDAVGDKGFELYKLLDLGDTLASADTCFAPAPANSASTSRRSPSSAKTCCPCPRSGTASPTSSCATASATSTW